MKRGIGDRREGGSGGERERERDRGREGETRGRGCDERSRQPDRHVNGNIHTHRQAH